MGSMYKVWSMGGYHNTHHFVKDKETADILIKMGVYDGCEKIFLLEGDVLANRVFNHYDWLRDLGELDKNLSDEELEKKITEDSKGIITF